MSDIISPRLYGNPEKSRRSCDGIRWICVLLAAALRSIINWIYCNNPTVGWLAVSLQSSRLPGSWHIVGVISDPLSENGPARSRAKTAVKYPPFFFFYLPLLCIFLLFSPSLRLSCECLLTNHPCGYLLFPLLLTVQSIEWNTVLQFSSVFRVRGVIVRRKTLSVIQSFILLCKVAWWLIEHSASDICFFIM